jgi:hypothetical protein
MEPMRVKKWLKSAVVYATCACASYSAWLIYSGERPVVSVMISAAMTWLTVFLGDPWGKESLDRIETSIATLNERITGIAIGMNGLEERINVRFDNLGISLATPPGAPTGVDEDVQVARAADAGWVRDTDAELEDRLLRRRRNMPDVPVLPPVPVYPAE